MAKCHIMAIMVYVTVNRAMLQCEEASQEQGIVGR
jgi:hypothetical protein